MHVIEVRNVNDALVEGIYYLNRAGIKEASRNGPVVVAPGPVTTEYRNPTERVIFNAQRDANPFFHFFEALWMLAGRNDVAYPAMFAKNIKDYSDDGETFHGAYGYRWRKWFNYSGHTELDQLKVIIEALKKNPACRRQILQMWDVEWDLGKEGKDFPCNLSAHFQIRGGRLDMTVFNRSNDVVWGAYGANAVHFSMLQEYMAAHIGVAVGRYWQVSDNYHVYDDVMKSKQLWRMADLAPDGVFKDYTNPYTTGEVVPYPMIQNPEQWEKELPMFLDFGTAIMGYKEPFFRKVAGPMFRAWLNHKAGDKAAAIEDLNDCIASDWRKAGTEWLTRRLKRSVTSAKAAT